MKTLDEVIDAMENCYGSDAECCDKCSYIENYELSEVWKQANNRRRN